MLLFFYLIIFPLLCLDKWCNLGTSSASFVLHKTMTHLTWMCNINVQINVCLLQVSCSSSNEWKKNNWQLKPKVLLQAEIVGIRLESLGFNFPRYSWLLLVSDTGRYFFIVLIYICTCRFSAGYIDHFCINRFDWYRTVLVKI